MSNNSKLFLLKWSQNFPPDGKYQRYSITTFEPGKINVALNESIEKTKTILKSRPSAGQTLALVRL